MVSRVSTARPAPNAAPSSAADAVKLFGPLTGLSALERGQLEAIAAGENPLSRRAREALKPLLSKPGFQSAPATEKLQKIREVFNRSVSDVVSAEAPELLKGQKTAAGKVALPVTVLNYTFEVRGGTHVTAQRFDLTVNGVTVPLYRPANNVFTTGGGAKTLINHTPEEVARGLSLMTPNDLKRIKEVRLSPVPNPQDSAWARAYKEKGFQSYMNGGADGVITIFPWSANSDPTSIRDLTANLMHELGHVSTNGAWGTGRGSGRNVEWAQWQRAAKADGLYASAYAKDSVEEDAAETDSLRKMAFSATPFAGEFRALFPHRIEILERDFPVK